MTDAPTSQAKPPRARFAMGGFGAARVAPAAAIVLAAWPAFVVACGGADKVAAAPSAQGPGERRSEAIEHERCDEKGAHVEALDTNGDGRPDVRRVFDGQGGHEVCRLVDLNRDGRTDLYEYFDANGEIRRREFCYDDSGVVNAIEFYEHGKLTARVYDTTGQHKIDTWDWFDPHGPVDSKTGRPAHPVRRERDIRGEGSVDQWWIWSGDRLTISTDRNGDGRPDPQSVIVLGGDDGGGATAQPPAVPQALVGDDAGSTSVSDRASGETKASDGGVGADAGAS
jgi:hypothetical protein